MPVGRELSSILSISLPPKSLVDLTSRLIDRERRNKVKSKERTTGGRKRNEKKIREERTNAENGKEGRQREEESRGGVIYVRE